MHVSEWRQSMQVAVYRASVKAVARPGHIQSDVEVCGTFYIPILSRPHAINSHFFPYPFPVLWLFPFVSRSRRLIPISTPIPMQWTQIFIGGFNQRQGEALPKYFWLWSFCCNRKHIYDFLLVINFCHLSSISQRFRDIASRTRSKFENHTTPVWASRSRNPLRLS